MEKEVWRYGYQSAQEAQRIGARKRQTKTHVCRSEPGSSTLKRDSRKKVLKPSEKKKRAQYLIEDKGAKVQRACRVVNLPRSQWYYQSKKDDSLLMEVLERLAQEHPTRGFDNYYMRIRNEGYKWNRKRVLRVYRKMSLSLRRKRKRRLPARIKHPLKVPRTINRTWSADYMHDSLEYGRKVRVLNIIDDFSREALIVNADYSQNSSSLVRQLEELIWTRGVPKKIRVDNGPEFVSKLFMSWCDEKEIEIQHIQPGKPTQNAYIERFNRLFREDVLDAYIFEDLRQLRKIAEEWRTDYNLNHPHSSLGGVSPIRYLKELNLKVSI